MAQERIQQAVVAAKGGDTDAIRYLYATFAGTVHRHVAHMLGDIEADDVTQTVFLRLMTRIGSYERREAAFEAWLLHVAHNAALDHLRRAKTQPIVWDPTHDELERGRPSPGAGDEALRAALETLPPSQREVAVLRFVVGLSPAETARRMHRTEASVNNLHHRARLGLQEALNALGAAPTPVSRRKAAGSRAQRGAHQGGDPPGSELRAA